MITKRVLLDSIPIINLAESGSGDNPSLDPSIPETPTIPSLPAIAPEYSFEKNSVPGYGTPLPVTDVDFAFPADDQKRVQAWFTGDFSHVTLPESATLKKNMTAAVLGAVNTFINSAISKNLFTAPFMIGYRYRLFDDSLVYPSKPVLLCPTNKAPDLIITGYKVYEKSLHTEVAISHYPGLLRLAVPSPENAEEYRDIITSVEFFITRPVELYASDAQVSGIRSVSVDGERQRVWYYDRCDSEILEAMAKGDSNYRLIGTIPFADIASGKYSALTIFPLEAGALQRFASLTKVTIPASGVTGAGSTGSGNTGGTTGIGGWRPYLHIVTSPLDLGEPEKTKSVSDLYLRGIFQRSEVAMTLYGSHHREGWRLLARSRGPYIRGLRRAPYRWYKVELELPMRRDDLLEALTFRFRKGG